MIPLKARIFLADDHEVVRRGLRALLESQPGWEICGEANDGRTAVQEVSSLKPDIVIMDIGMKALNGLDATRDVRRSLPQCKVLVLSMHESDQLVREVLAAGASGYVLKSDAGRDLVAAIEALLRGRQFFSAATAARRSGWTPRDGRRPAAGLTRREREIVQLLAEGMGNRAVAEHLKISVKTVETHRARSMRKLKLKSFAELVRYAIRNHIAQL